MTTLPEILAQVKDALEFYRSGANFSGSPHENYERQFDNYGHGGAYVEDGTVAQEALALLDRVSVVDVSTLLVNVYEYGYGEGEHWGEGFNDGLEAATTEGRSIVEIKGE